MSIKTEFYEAIKNSIKDDPKPEDNPNKAKEVYN